MNLEELFKPIVPIIENINILAYFMMFVRKWRFSTRTVLLSFGAIFVFLLAPYNIWFTLQYGTSRDVINTYTPLSHAVLLVALLIMGKMENGRLLFSLSVSYMLVYLCGIFCKPFQSGSYYYQCCVRLLFFGIFFYLNYRYHKKRLFDAMNWIDRGWYFLALIPISVIPHCMYIFNEEQVSTLSYVICFNGFLTYFILLWVFSLLKKQQQMKQEDTLLHTHVAVFRQFYDQLEEINTNRRILRHDLRHYTLMLRNAIHSGKQEEALEILRHMETKFVATEVHSFPSTGILPPENFQGPSMINALLAYYQHQANRCNISTKISVVMPENAAFDLTEFSVLVSNSVENAIHACLKLSSPEMRKIVISGDVKQEQFFFEIKNTYQEKISFENGIPVTSAPGHGTGVLSICAFASKYNALLDFEEREGWFRLRLLI